MSFKIHRNMNFFCKMVIIDGLNCDFDTEINIAENNISQIIISHVSQIYYEKIKRKDSIVIVVKKDEEYITVQTDFLLSTSLKCCEPTESEQNYMLIYSASVLLCAYYPIRGEEMFFDGFKCKVTEGIELFGIYPYTVEEQKEEIGNINVHMIGKIKRQDMGGGFSCVVAPQKRIGVSEINFSMQGEIFFLDEKLRSISEMKEILNNISLFLELLSGETITVNEVKLCKDDKIYDYIGYCNFPKEKLLRLEKNMTTRSCARRGIFKITDFGDDSGEVVEKYKQLIDENELAYQAYQQVLLDEEINIITYNKFLKIMQMVEGYFRDKKECGAEKDFEEHKKNILEKLCNSEDVEFIDKYTNYNGQTFRKCMKDITYESLKIVSCISKKEVQKQSDKIISRIINDRDVYTHASKEKEPTLSAEELGKVNYCYKTFFRILNLHKMGMSDLNIRIRLAFDREFVFSYKELFELEIKKDKDGWDTGEFDQHMLWYNKRNDGLS